MEGIEYDRSLIKGMAKYDKMEINAAVSASLKDKKISYISTLLKMTKKVKKMDETTATNRTSLKIKAMSTKNILYAVSESFKNINKKTIERLEKIKSELLTRSDLFTSILEHLESSWELEDDLFSWYPGLKTSDMFGFFLELIPDLLIRYKEYYIKNTVLNAELKTNMLKIFKDRMYEDLQCFDVIERDLTIFEQMKKPNLSFNSKIITTSYWKNNAFKFNELKEMLGIIDSAKLSDDIFIELCYNLSYANVTINEKDVIATFLQIQDLLTKNDRSLEFWVKEGIVDENWNEI